MTLIECPECDGQVSDLASACPHCGFPVAAGIRHAVAELTEEDRVKSARQKQAGAKLRIWGERYEQPQLHDPSYSQSESFIDRHWRPIMVVIAVVIAALQVAFVLSLFR